MTFPKLLTSRLETILGSDFQSVMDVFSHERAGSFRINTLKSSESEVLAEFKEKGIIVEKFAGLDGVYTFTREHEYAMKGSRAFYDGKIYLQSISSILPALSLSPQKGENILDVCAAPGSKTTQIAMMMGNEGSIVALEQNQIRYDKLMYNARLQGATIIEGEKTDARVFLSLHSEGNEKSMSLNPGSFVPQDDKRVFDRILLDAPCSAEGRIHLPNEKSYGFWTLENIKKKAEIQYELLSLAVQKLKTGGTLVYSTCTLAPEENEGVLTRVLAENSDLSLEPIDIGLSNKSWWKSGIIAFGSQRYSEEMSKAVRMLPSGETEGFFVGKILKS